MSDGGGSAGGDDDFSDADEISYNSEVDIVEEQEN
jgi:hypothetical protein